MKLNITEFAIKYFVNQRKKIYKNKYPEIKEIFGKENKALEYSDCDGVRAYHQYMMLLYKIHNKDIENTYHYILDKIATLIKDIKPNPSLADILYIYCYLLYNGYFSINNKFNFTIPKKELAIRKGFNIFCGNGVCRNVSSLLSDVLSYLDVYNFGTTMYQTAENSEAGVLIKELDEICNKDAEAFRIEYQNFIDENYDEIYEINNHFQVIAYRNGMYLLDPSTLFIAKITNKKTNYPIINNLRLSYLYYSGEQSMKFTISTFNLLKNKFVKVCRSNKLLTIQKDCYNRCEKNKQKILKFRKDIDEDIKYINDAMMTLPEK